jgi:hypothetical protein
MIDDIEYYEEGRGLSLDVLSLDLIRQLSYLTRRVLEADGRESGYVDEHDRVLTARIARLDNTMALAEANEKVGCFLIETGDDAAFRLKARRRLFSFEADDFMAPGNWRFCPVAPPDIWYNMTVTTLATHIDRNG